MLVRYVDDHTRSRVAGMRLAVSIGIGSLAMTTPRIVTQRGNAPAATHGCSASSCRSTRFGACAR
jgi:hypothetical protein